LLDLATQAALRHQLEGIFGSDVAEAANPHAFAIVEAQLDLARVRRVKRALLEQHLPDRKSTVDEMDPGAAALLSSLDGLRRLDRYEARAIRNRDGAVMAYLRAHFYQPPMNSGE
jgi:hypothetical protein